MHLKKVELSGFKSFADRTEVDFAPGITAIVGPNGSGKSNITDAVRWVLGEQSAKNLRGAKMEDIIFGGSDSRKPVNFSEVSLTLDNEDHSLDMEYAEVTVTRRLYRSGESDYFINNQSCRLKDITQLFMDTGLGKEAYSIIGQGKIEEILSSRSEDRRGVFEEAAGIVKYKTRKKESQKKLDETEQNLLRIQDLISELAGQIEPLENQAAKARKYKQLAEALKEINIQTYVYDIEKTHQDWTEMENVKKGFTDELVDLQAMVSQIDAAIEGKRWSANQLEKELEELQQQLIEISEEVERAEGKREVFKERANNQTALKTQTIQEIDRLREKKESIINQIITNQEKIGVLKESIARHTEKLKKEEMLLSESSIDSQSAIESHKNDYFELLNNITTLRNELRHYQMSKESLLQKIKKGNNDADQLKAARKELQEKKENGIKENTYVQSEVVRLGEEYRQLVNSQRQLMLEKEEKTTYLQKLQQKLDSLSSRQDVLKEMQADFSGFQFGVKEILKYRDRKQINGIHGAIAEVLTVSKKYELAIETALGGVLQYVIVDNEEVGRKAISILKEKKLGKATFLPLNVMTGKRIPEYEIQKLQKLDGYIGVAVDLINAESNYQKIMEYYLGQVIIVSSLKVANDAAKILGYRNRIVTVDGDVVNPGGSMTGGSSQKKNGGLLSRQREIDELDQQLKELKQELTKAQVSIEKVKLTENSIQEQIERVKEQGEEVRINEQKINGLIKQFEYELKSLNERLMLMDQDLSSNHKEFEEITKKIFSIETNLEEQGKIEKELQAKIEELEQSRKNDESKRESVSQTITDLKIQVARLNQELEGTIETFERLKNERKEIEENIHNQQEIYAGLEESMLSQQDNEKALQGEIESVKLKKASLQKIIEEKRKSRSILIQDIDTQESGIKETRKKLKTVEEGLHQAEVKLNRLDVELNNLLTLLSEEYEVSYEWAKEHIRQVEDIQEAKKKVRQFKMEIQALGEVNLGAIEEFDRVSERHHFLTTQKADLVNAKDSLYQVINEIEEEMSKRFLQSFEAIREQFQIVFVKLFGGGRADLILSDPENLLETGVEIIAQPPGKKLQNLALLSGGEKALTAITLLFSILRVKPVPFCILDEVEAALDEANVTRFAGYLKEFSEKTQFIVVTHRKGTMEGSNVLYGVTMQESGVSRLVSVKLAEKEKVIQMA